MQKSLYFQKFRSKIGNLRIVCDDKNIIRLLFENDNLDTTFLGLSKQFGSIAINGGNSLTEICREELLEYLAGKRQAFSVAPVFFGSAFQTRVWESLLLIPYGMTTSYLSLAGLAKVNGCRAVGGAVGRNPVPIIVPCHRVIRADGSLGGFRGGLDNKLKLLSLEGVKLHN